MGSQTALAPKGSPNAAPAPSPIVSFMPMIVVIGILYLLIIRPQQKQAKQHRQMVDNLKSGDRVLTQGGIYGTVAGLKGNVIQLKIADNVRIEVSRSAITQVLNEPTLGGNAPGLGEKS
jgi:preprotein translocase subunit YajC